MMGGLLGCWAASQSAKSNLNVENVFFTIARDIKQRLAETTEASKPEVHRKGGARDAGESWEPDCRSLCTVQSQHCDQGSSRQDQAQVFVLLRELRDRGRELGVKLCCVIYEVCKTSTRLLVVCENRPTSVSLWFNW